MDRFTDDARFSGFSNDTYEQKPAMDYSLESELRKTIQRQKKTIFSLAERNRVWKIISLVLAILLVVQSIVLWANTNSDTPKIPDASQNQPQQSTQTEVSEVQVPTEFAVDEQKISQMLSQMTLIDKIHQMLFVTPEELTGYESVTAAGESTETALGEHKVGGIIYAPSNIENIDQAKEMLGNTAEFAVMPVFLGFERKSGTIAENGTYSMPSQSVIGAYSDKAQVSADYVGCAKELANLGFNVNFAPGTELVSVTDSAIVASFGSDVKNVADTVAMAVKGQLMHNVSTALQFFPTDTTAQRTAEQLRTSEFEVYKAGIAAGADFITVSHKINTALDGEGVPYSMSKSVVTDLLRGELGYDGIVVCAPLSQLDYTEEFTPSVAAIRCIKAGVDMLLCPPDMEQLVEDINEAVRIGELDVSIIDESVKRILRTKQKRGLVK